MMSFTKAFPICTIVPGLRAPGDKGGKLDCGGGEDEHLPHQRLGGVMGDVCAPPLLE